MEPSLRIQMDFELQLVLRVSRRNDGCPPVMPTTRGDYDELGVALIAWA
jgi:hypothetical protein